MFVGEWCDEKGKLLTYNVRAAIRARNEIEICVLLVSMRVCASQGSDHYKAKVEFNLTTAPGGYGSPENTMTVQLYDATALVHSAGSCSCAGLLR